jgi:hypothetical protein
MNAAEFDSAKIDIAQALYPSAVDPERWIGVYSALDFDSSRSELRKRLGQSAGY